MSYNKYDSLPDKWTTYKYIDCISFDTIDARIFDLQQCVVYRINNGIFDWQRIIVG